MKDLEDFARRREALLATLESIADSDLIPVEEIDATVVRDRQEQLRDERFVLAVCGQMKAGKSTLINALAFGRPVLPHAVTVTTAKVATLARGRRERVVAQLFDRAEWQSLRAQADRVEGGAEALNRDVEAAASAGYRVAEMIRTPGHRIERESLDTLAEVVAVPERGGTVSPFVKLVELEHTVEWLRDVVIADTPGFNDPNPVRNRVTAEWIGRADAVVFVTFAGQAMSQQDVQFIDAHLLHVPPRRRVIAINKIDTIDDVRRVEDYIDRLASRDSRMKSLLGDRASRVPVCAQAALIDVMRDSDTARGEELSEEEEVYLEEGQLDPEFHGLGRLRELIERRLLENKGEGVIEAAEGFVRAIFERNLLLTERQLASLEEEEEVAGLDRASLQRELEQARRDKLDWDDKSATLLQAIERALEDGEQALDDGLVEWKSAIIREMRGKLAQYDALHQFDASLLWDFREIVEARHDSLRGPLRRFRENAEKLLADARTDALAFLSKRGSQVRIRLADVLVDASLAPIQQQLDQRIDATLDRGAIAAAVREAAGWWGGLWGTEKGKGRARDEVDSTLRKLALELGRAAKREIVDAVDESVRKGARAIADAIQIALRDREKLVSEQQAQAADLDTQLAELASRRATLEARRAEIVRRRDEVLNA